MRWIQRWVTVVPLAALLQPVGCRKVEEEASEAKAAEVEHLEGDEPTRVKLTADAVKRLDIQTDIVRDAAVKGTTGKSGTPGKVMPYDAILYDTEGGTWTYTNPEALTYVRHRITVDHITGDLAFLSDGPPSGTAVVTVGAAELYGAEIEFEEE